jgi:hypothetical protein
MKPFKRLQQSLRDIGQTAWLARQPASIRKGLARGKLKVKMLAGGKSSRRSSHGHHPTAIPGHDA